MNRENTRICESGVPGDVQQEAREHPDRPSLSRLCHGDGDGAVPEAGADPQPMEPWRSSLQGGLLRGRPITRSPERYRQGACVEGYGSPEVPPRCRDQRGNCGPLAGDLRVRDIVLASETLADNTESKTLQSDPLLTDCLRRACLRDGRTFRIDRLVTVREAVFKQEDRRLLQRSSLAAAVDMESHAIAEAARGLGVPFGCIRVISDDFSSPTMPLSRSPRMSYNSVGAIAASVMARWRRRRFLRQFEGSIEVLPPVLVRFIRELRRTA